MLNKKIILAASAIILTASAALISTTALGEMTVSGSDKLSITAPDHDKINPNKTGFKGDQGMIDKAKDAPKTNAQTKGQVDSTTKDAEKKQKDVKKTEDEYKTAKKERDNYRDKVVPDLNKKIAEKDKKISQCKKW